MALDLVGLVNFLLNLAIIAISYLGFRRTDSKLYLFMALAFALFSMTNLLTGFGLATDALYLIIVARVISYCAVFYALYVGMGEGKAKGR